jgi:hypothetical protein
MGTAGLAIIPLLFMVVFLVAFVIVGWVLPITLGIRCADSKGYSRLWMLFGIHPVSGWIAFIVLSTLPGQRQCTNCGGFIGLNFLICPYCHTKLMPTVQSPASSRFEDAAMIRFTCQSCGSTLTAPSTIAGKTARCSECGETMTIP